MNVVPPLEELFRSRNIHTVIRALNQRRHYVAAVEALKQCERPVDFLSRYATTRGNYPTAISLRTRIGPITLSLYSWHDSRTIHEIFFALDYEIDDSASIIVDYGSNIGISSAYFLSINSSSRAYLFEPVPRNTERLQANLLQFGGRFDVEEVDVADNNEEVVRFGVELTGRHGGIDTHTGNYIDVACRNCNRILQTIVYRHGRIDVLKVDVERMEARIINHLNQDLASKIGLILVEHLFDQNPLKSTHEMSTRGTISRFKLRS